MSKTVTEIRRGTYYDSIVLMQLQAALEKLADGISAGVIMGTPANKELLRQNDLLTPEAAEARPDDLLIVISAATNAAAENALASVDELLQRRQAVVEEAYRPRTLSAAMKMLPDAQWVLVSVPGRYAARLSREALEHDKHVFLYSDNVSKVDEASLKKLAADKGKLLMGPDCGTAIVNGVGLGFANQVRRGAIGLVGASGTGLQHISSRIHELGAGVSHVLGTGGRDLDEQVGGITARQSLQLLADDPETKVIVLISKHLSAGIFESLLGELQEIDKPVVIDFLGAGTPANRDSRDNLRFVYSLDEAADCAVELLNEINESPSAIETVPLLASGYLRGLFSGGTLAQEVHFLLQPYLLSIYSNLGFDKATALENVHQSRGHTIVDMGADEFTVGRLHPMMDNSLRVDRFKQEAMDPQVSCILLDIVLGHGSHPDPASEFAEPIRTALQQAAGNDRELKVYVLMVGTDEDPQDLSAQIEKLQNAGANVFTSCREVAVEIGAAYRRFTRPEPLPPIDPKVLTEPLQAINAGLDFFSQSLEAQGASVVQMDWRPPAGGNEELMALLDKMK